VSVLLTYSGTSLVKLLDVQYLNHAESSLTATTVEFMFC